MDEEIRKIYFIVEGRNNKNQIVYKRGIEIEDYSTETLKESRTLIDLIWQEMENRH